MPGINHLKILFAVEAAMFARSHRLYLQDFIMILTLFLISICWEASKAQGPYFPNHWYGANTANVRSGVVPEWGPVPMNNGGTLAPHVCGFNPFTRKCMDPENYCPGRCMNFRYTYNTLYDCRCLVVNK